MVENIHDFAIFATDTQGRIVSWNPGVKRLLGYDEAEFVGQHASLIFTPEDLEQGADVKEMQRAASEGRAEDKRWHVRRDGSRFWANGFLMPLWDAAGNLRGFAKVMRDDTAHKRAEDERERLLCALESERLRLEQILQQIPASVSIVEAPTGKRLFWNEEAERLLGHPIAFGEYYQDHSRFGALHPDGRSYEPDEYPTVRALLTGETITGEEMLYRRSDGHLLTLSVNSTPIRDHEGQVVAAAAIFTDITKRKRAREERERFFALGSNLLVVAGFDGYFKWISPAWERTFGWTAEELIAHPWLYFTHPDDHEQTVKEAQKLLAGQETVAFENRYRCKDGSYRWISWNTKPYTEEQLLYCAATDITERKEAEEALRESAERFRFLAESMPQKIFTAKPNGDVDYFNQQWTQFTGLSFEQIRDWGWTQFIHPDDVEENVRRWQHSIDTGEPFQFEHRFRRADGVYHWHLSRAHAMRDAEGRVLMWIGSNTDIDDVKRAGEERERLLQREQEAREEAERANRLKDEFLATLSHELRTPLTAILGWARMLQTNNFDETAAARALETIERNARTQSQLIDDLLDVSRIVTGKLRLDVRAVDLPAVVTAAVDTLRPAAEARGIHLQILLDPRAGPVSGDPDRLQQVVWNLVSNAIKFTPKGGRVQVRLERVNSHVEITVADTGTGIAAEFLPHVFDRFRQADQTMTRKYGGLGLGLAIVRQLVELHGGTVHVESRGEGEGATFTVSLPLLPVRAERRAADAERVHPKAHTGAADCPPELNDLNVLVVDDEPDTRDLLAAVLTNCGAHVTQASTAAEALELLERGRFDVLISDIGMPVEDGYSFIRKVRALPPERGGRTPAAALTAYAREEDRIRALMAGYQIHVPKPVGPAELAAVVANLTGRTARG